MGSSSSKAPVGNPAVVKELDKADAVLLTVNQTKTLFKDSSTLSAVTTKSLESLLDKLTARLTPDMRQLCGAGWVAGASDAHRGMDALQKMTEAQG